MPTTYSTPFEPIRNKQKSPTLSFATIEDTTIDYLKCKDTSDIRYFHCLNCIIKIVTNMTLCFSLRNLVLLKELLCELTKMPYEDYLQKNQPQSTCCSVFKFMTTLCLMKTMKYYKFKAMQ